MRRGKGTGQITERRTKAGTSYGYRVTVHGKRISRSGYKTRLEAEQALNKLVGDTGLVTPGLVTTVPAVVYAWAVHTADEVAGSTAATRRSLHNGYIEPLFDVPVAELTGSLIESVFRVHGVGYATGRGVVTMLKAALRWAARPDINIIPHNPLRDVTVRLPGKGGRWEPFTNAELGKLLAASEGLPSHHVWALLAGTGLRKGEATPLTVADIDLQAQTVVVSKIATPESKGSAIEYRVKTGQARQAPLSDELAAKLREIMPDAGNLFPSPLGKGKHVGFTTLGRWWARDMAEAGLAGRERLTIHSLRHTFATQLISEGVPEVVVASLLGHANPTVTRNVYSHALAQDVREAVNRLKLG